MKRRIILVSRSVVCVLLVGCTALSAYSLRASQTKGGYSDVCGRVSPESREWIIEHFGDSPTFEELLRQLDIFAIEHFVYGDVPLIFGYLQSFDLDEFLFGESRFRGLCFDFSCWVKCCVLVWAEKHGIPVKAFVLDVKGQKYAHSYNIFYCEDRTYSLDVTIDQTRVKKGEKPEGPLYWGSVTIKQIAEHYGEKAVIWR